jgi:hypothetical protein
VFKYIFQNPVEADIAAKITEWEYSNAKELSVKAIIKNPASILSKRDSLDRAT